MKNIHYSHLRDDALTSSQIFERDNIVGKLQDEIQSVKEDKPSFAKFLIDLDYNTVKFRKATYIFENEMLQFLNVDLDFFDNLTMTEIKESLIGKRDSMSLSAILNMHKSDL